MNALLSPAIALFDKFKFATKFAIIISISMLSMLFFAAIALNSASEAEQRSVVIGLIAAFLVLLYLFMALFVSLKTNIAKISHGVSKLAEGDFQKLPEFNSHDELAEIASSLNYLRVRVAKRVSGVLTSSGLLVEQSEQMMAISKKERQQIELQKGEISGVAKAPK